MRIHLHQRSPTIRILLVAVAVFTMGPLIGCWKHPPERSPVSGDYRTFLLAPFSAESNESGAWTLDTNAPSVSFPYGTETVMLCVPMECADPESLPPFLVFNLTNSDGVTYASGALQKRITDDGKAEYVHDSRGVDPRGQRCELTASFWLIQDDPDQQLVLPVQLVDAFGDQND